MRELAVISFDVMNFVEGDFNKSNWRGSSSAGRALAFQAGGREFESRLPLQTAHVAQSVERFLGKEEVHRFDSGRGLH